MDTQAHSDILEAVTRLNSQQDDGRWGRETVSVRRIHNEALGYSRSEIRRTLDQLVESGALNVSTPHLALDYRIA